MVIVTENDVPHHPGTKEQRFFFFLMAEEITRSIIKNILMFKYELF